MLVAGYAFRYEPDWMIDQLEDNLIGIGVDRFVAYNTRDASEPWVNAKARTAELYRKALEQGETPLWFLQTAPDERFEDGAGDLIADAMSRFPQSRFTFNLREMYTPTAYRVDGVWGKKVRRRLYRLGPSGPFGKAVHHLDVNIYHLKMIEPDNRRRRRDVFAAHNTWDNKAQGFDYLIDETNIDLEVIPEGRGYTPAYRTYEFLVPGFD